MKIFTVVLLGFLFLFNEAYANIKSEKDGQWRLYSQTTCENLSLLRMRRNIGSDVQDRLEYQFRSVPILSVITKPGVGSFESDLVVRVYLDDVAYVFSGMTYSQYIEIATEIIQAYDSTLHLKLAECVVHY